MRKEFDEIKKWLKAPRIICSPAELQSLDGIDYLPRWWSQIVALVNVNDKKHLALQQWEQCAAFLPTTLKCLKESCVAVDLVENEGDVGVVYSLNVKGKNQYLWGGIPFSDPVKVLKPRVNTVWEQLPADLKAFHQRMHDGFMCLNYRRGIVKSRDFEFLDEEEWGVVEDYELRDFPLADHMIMYSNGRGLYVCVNVVKANDVDNNGVVWYNDMRPYLGHSLWRAVDEEIASTLGR